MTPEQSAYIAYRLERAKATLRDAEILAGAGSLHGAVNRLYYACFYTVSALLLSEGQSRSKHTGVRALFEKDWVRTGRVSVPTGRFFHALLDRRQKSDYSDLVAFDPQEVAGWLAQGSAFVAELTRLVEQRLSEDAARPPE